MASHCPVPHHSSSMEVCTELVNPAQPAAKGNAEASEASFSLMDLPSELIHHIIGLMDVGTVCNWLGLLEIGESEAEAEGKAEGKGEGEKGAEGYLKELARHAHRNTLHWLGEYYRRAGMYAKGVPADLVNDVARAMERLRDVPEEAMFTVFKTIFVFDVYDELGDYDHVAVLQALEKLVVVHCGVCIPAVRDIRGGLVVVVGDVPDALSTPIGDSRIVIVGEADFVRMPAAGYSGNVVTRIWM